MLKNCNNIARGDALAAVAVSIDLTVRSDIRGSVFSDHSRKQNRVTDIDTAGAVNVAAEQFTVRCFRRLCRLCGSLLIFSDRRRSI